MSFSKLSGALPVAVVVIFSSLFSYAEGSGQSLSSGDSLVRVIRDLNSGNEKKAKVDIGAISVPEVKGFSRERLNQYYLLDGYLNPPSSLSSSGIRKSLSQVGRNVDLVFWRAYQGPMGKKYSGPSLSNRLSAMFPDSNYFHPEGGSGAHSAQALWRRSLSEFRRDHPKRALTLWKRIYQSHPLSPEAGLALQRLPQAMPMGELLIPRWKTLASMGQKKVVLKEAMAYLKTSPPFPFRDRAILFAASGLLAESRKDEALALVEKGKSAKGAKLLSSLWLEECSAEDSSVMKKNCIHQFLSRYPLSLAGRSLANASLRASIAAGGLSFDPLWMPPPPIQSLPSGETSMWLSGLWFASHGEVGRARDVWKELASILSPGGDDVLLPRLTYFLGRLDGMEHHLERAQRRYRKVMKRWPFSVYALWSSLACGENCGSFAVTFHHPSPQKAHLTLSHRQRLLNLIQLGLWGAAWTDYVAYRDHLMTEERFIRYGNLSLRLDSVRKLVLIDAVLGRSRPSVILSRTESLSPSVISAFQNSGVPVSWAISIARQESRYDPTVLSIDGAMGVMQLMPMTALSTLSQVNPSLLEGARLNLGSLRGDYINALVGGLYLKRLFDHFPRNPERAVASYNAGMHSIVRWSGIASMDWDFFIEGIPYTETRRYAREVLWNHEVLRKSPRHLFVSGR